MATCKDCVGNDFCNERPSVQRNLEKKCSRFKNKADYAEVKHGEWKKESDVIGRPYMTCSVCKKHVFAISEYDYCPSCGVKMDGEGS